MSFDPGGYGRIRRFIEEACVRHQDCKNAEVRRFFDEFENKVWGNEP